MFQRIIVAYDGSEQAQKAFEQAVALAKLDESVQPEIMVVSVAQPPEPIDIVEMDAVIDGVTQRYEEQFKNLRGQAQQMGIQLRTDVIVGHPAEQIVRYASQMGCDIILIGHRGRSAIAEFIMGSVSRRVAAYAPCSVMIVK